MVKNILQTSLHNKINFQNYFLKFFFHLMHLQQEKSISLNSGFISRVDLGVAFGLEILHSGL